jgi:hypothetical protein
LAVSGKRNPRPTLKNRGWGTLQSSGHALAAQGKLSGSGESWELGGVNKIFKKHVRRLINWWPPFLGAGIRVTRLDADWRAVDVEMKLRWWNRNYVGTHYGGSLYSMVDPFYMVMLIENLGREYVVWDKTASIRFRKPGRGTVRAEFRLTGEQIEEIRRALEKEEKIEREFDVDVKDESGEVIAEVKKVVHFRRKRDSSPDGMG